MTVKLSDIVSALCARAGLTSIDVAELDDVEIEGYVIGSQSDGLAAIAPLRMVGGFDIIDRGTELHFAKRGAAPVATILEDELGALDESDDPAPAITTTKTQDVELPLQIRLQYSSLARDYETGEQLSPARVGTIGVNEITIQCPVILDDDVAAQVAEILMRDAWIARWQHAFTLDQTRWALEEGDPILVPIDGRLQRMRIVSFENVGVMLRRAQAVRDDDGAYVSTAVATPPLRPPTALSLIGEVESNLLDLPALREADSDPGFYSTAHRIGLGVTWSGARLYRSVDDGATYKAVAGLANQAITGRVVTGPLAGDGFTWDDEQSYEVDIEGDGTLESRTDAAVLAGANAAAVGAHGRWHIFQFSNAELIGTKRYKLTRLLLGRRGTEYLIPTVSPGDKFVLISGAGIYRTVLESSEIGAERLYRAVMAGAAFDSADSFDFTGQGQALKPFSPVNVTYEVDGSDNVTIRWQRRDRLGQTLRDGVETPMSETTEAYEIEIMNGTSFVARTLTASNPEVLYSAANQTADFGALNPAPPVRIYQMSSVVGRGIPFLSPGLGIGEGGPPAAGTQYYGEQVTRPFIDTGYLYAQRATGVSTTGAILQIRLSDATLVNQTIFAQTIRVVHSYAAAIWVLGKTLDDARQAKLFQQSFDTSGFGALVTESLDVSDVACAYGIGNNLYALRTNPSTHVSDLIRIELDTPAITDTVGTDGKEKFLAANTNYVFALRDATTLGGDGRLDRRGRDLAADTSIDVSATARSLYWDENAGQLYLLSPTAIVAYDEDLTELWSVDIETATGAIDPASYGPVDRGLNFAVEPTRSEVLIALQPTSWPSGANVQDYLLVARFDDSDGSYKGHYPLRGALQPALSAGGTLYVDLYTLEGPFSIPVQRLGILTSSYLSTIEVGP